MKTTSAYLESIFGFIGRLKDLTTPPYTFLTTFSKIEIEIEVEIELA